MKHLLALREPNQTAQNKQLPYPAKVQSLTGAESREEVTYKGVVGYASKDALRPSFHPLTPAYRPYEPYLAGSFSLVTSLLPKLITMRSQHIYIEALF